MSSVLHIRLKEYLTEALKPIKLLGQPDSENLNSDEQVCQVQVFIGDLPPKQVNNKQQDIPCIVIVPLSGHQEGGEVITSLALICIVYNPDGRDSEAAEADLATLLSGIVGALAPFSQGVPLDDRFELEPDSRGRLLPWVKSENQARPFLQVTMTSQWKFKGWE